MKYTLSVSIACLLSCFACQAPQAPKNIDEKENKDSSNTVETTVDTANADLVVVNNDTLCLDPNLSPEHRKKVLDIINKEYLTGRFNPAQDGRFDRVAGTHLVNPNSDPIYMRGEAYAQFIKMQDAAKKEGVRLKIMSATRPFNLQKAIWERKWLGRQKVNGKIVPQDAPAKAKAEQILEWNSMPSTSRHHWGTDIDINNVDPVYWAAEPGLKEYEWLTAHGHEYGFCQVYSKMGADRPYGYQEEKWHWSYIPIARELVKEYKKQIKNKDIDGFLGAETAEDISVVEKYVLGINPACQ